MKVSLPRAAYTLSCKTSNLRPLQVYQWPAYILQQLHCTHDHNQSVACNFNQSISSRNVQEVYNVQLKSTVHSTQHSFTQTVNPDSFGIDQWLDYKTDVNAIIDAVQNYNESSSCCTYNYQILDKFCASQSAVSAIDQNVNNDKQAESINF